MQKTSDYPYYRCEFREFNVVQSAVLPFLDKDVNLVVASNTSTGKCISGDSKVVLANGEYRSIESIFDSSNGNTCDVLSLSQSDLKIKTSRATLVRFPSEQVYSITLKTGETIKVTPEHPFFVKRKDGMCWVRADQLSKQDYVAVPNLIPEPINTDSRINVSAFLDYAQRYGNFYVDGSERLRKFIEHGNGRKYGARKRGANRLDVEKFKIDYWLDKTKMPLKVYTKVGDVENSEHIQLFSRSSKVPTNIPVVMTSDLAWLLGIIIADGSLSSHTVRVFSGDKCVLGKSRKILHDIFGLDSTVSKDSRNLCFRLCCSSKVLVNFLNWIGIPTGKKSQIVYAPSLIMRQPNAVVRCFLSGLFDGDGYCEKFSIGYCSDSENLIDDVKLLLLRFGIVSFKKNRNIGGKLRYRLNIYGSKMTFLFGNKIGFSIHRKQKICKSLPKKTRVENTNFDIIPHCMDSLRKLKHKIPHRRKFSASIGHVISGRREHISKNALSVFLKENPLVGEKEWNELNMIVKSDILFVGVISVEKHPYGNFVYDMTVPKSQNFISNGIIVHNTALAECMFGYHLETNDTNKVIYVSPYKAISHERYRTWTANKQFASKGILLCTSDDVPTPEDFASCRIYIMTSESLDSKTRTPSYRGWLDDTACVVFDEAHLLAQDGRGSSVEAALMRVSHMNPKARLVLLSATMSNAMELAKWIKSLNGKETKCVQSNWRPVKIQFAYHGYKDDDEKDFVNTDRIETVAELVKQNRGEKILIFVHSKRIGKDVTERLRKMGVSCAFHNASLSASKREKIEKLFDDQNSGLNVLISTSTLSSGVNIGG